MGVLTGLRERDSLMCRRGKYGVSHGLYREAMTLGSGQQESFNFELGRQERIFFNELIDDCLSPTVHPTGKSDADLLKSPNWQHLVRLTGSGG